MKLIMQLIHAISFLAWAIKFHFGAEFISLSLEKVKFVWADTVPFARGIDCVIDHGIDYIQSTNIVA